METKSAINELKVLLGSFLVPRTGGGSTPSGVQSVLYHRLVQSMSQFEMTQTLENLELFFQDLQVAQAVNLIPKDIAQKIKKLVDVICNENNWNNSKEENVSAN